MTHWVCSDCFKLEGEALLDHIRAHSVTTVESADELARDLRGYHHPPGRAMDFNRIVLDETHAFRDGGLHHDVVPGKKTTLDAFAEFGRAWARLVEDLGKVFEPFAREAAKRLEPPASVMERALQARKNRNTGPTRPSGQAARRPRRHQ